MFWAQRKGRRGHSQMIKENVKGVEILQSPLIKLLYSLTYSEFHVTGWWLRLGGCLRSDSLANRLWDRDVHAGSWLGSALKDQHQWGSEGSRNRQTNGLNCYAELWSWAGSSELSCLKVRRLGYYSPIKKPLDVGCTSLLQMVCDTGWRWFLKRDSTDTISLWNAQQLESNCARPEEGV